MRARGSGFPSAFTTQRNAGVLVGNSMWTLSDLFRRSTPGPTPTEQLIAALQEHNALLRAQLEQSGVHVIPFRPKPTVPPRKRTAEDVTVVTRETVLDRQLKDRLQQEREFPSTSA